MPELLLTLSTPNPLKPQFVLMDGQRHLVYVDEGAPDDGEPFIYLDPNREEPHVRVRCRSYSVLDPPYYLIGTVSGTSFGTVQYIGPKSATDALLGRSLDFLVTDLSDGTEFRWTEQANQYGPRRAEILHAGQPCGEVAIGTGGEVIPGRAGKLRLSYLRSQAELNLLLHISAFAFILTRYYSYNLDR